MVPHIAQDDDARAFLPLFELEGDADGMAQFAQRFGFDLSVLPYPGMSPATARK